MSQNKVPLLLTYEISTNWKTGYQINFKLTNPTNNNIKFWEVHLELNLNQHISSNWNCEINNNFNKILKISNPKWYGAGIIGKKATVTFGMIIQNPSNTEAIIKNFQAMGFTDEIISNPGPTGPIISPGSTGSTENNGFINYFPFANLPGNMTLNQSDVIMSLVSIAENSSTKWWEQYNYAENIHDGRGITISLCGFCTGTYDFLMVVKELQKINPNHTVCRFIPALEKINGTSSTKGLETLIETINKLGPDTQWRTAVWNILIKLYWKPAMDTANKYGCVFPITKGELYDLALNHGSEKMEIMIKQIKSLSPSKGGNEKLWLGELLNVREHIITSVNTSTNKGQPDRTKMWRSILNNNNVYLTRPLKNLICYGDEFEIK